MNKQGQQKIFGLMIGATIIILALALAFPVSNNAERVRNQTNDDIIGLDCGNSSISDFDKATCIAVDIIPFYFIGVLIMIGGGFIALKVIFA